MTKVGNPLLSCVLQVLEPGRGVSKFLAFTVERFYVSSFSVCFAAGVLKEVLG